MKHPFTGLGLLYYLVAWAIVMSAHATVLLLGYDLDYRPSLSDAVFSNLLLAFLGFGIWWAVQYIKPNNQGTLSAVLSFFALVVFSAFIAGFITETALSSIYPNDVNYIWFLKSAAPWRFITSTLYLGIIILVYYLIRSSGALSQKEKEEAELQSLLKHTELEKLKFQINPHFIFNSLNSISSLTLTSPEKAREMIIKLSNFLRGSLGQGQSEMHSLEKELEQMSLYLDIEKVRFGDRLVVEKNLQANSMSCQIPNMILQPIVENAIKYGVYEQLENVKLTIDCYRNQNKLIVKVANNYDSEAVTQKGKGIGLKNVRNRLELIYGAPNLVTIERSKDQFCIILEIPQNK